MAMTAVQGSLSRLAIGIVIITSGSPLYNIYLLEANGRRKRKHKLLLCLRCVLLCLNDGRRSSTSVEETVVPAVAPDTDCKTALHRSKCMNGGIISVVRWSLPQTPEMYYSAIRMY